MKAGTNYYEIAVDMAKAKAQHYVAPGALELGAKSSWRYPEVSTDRSSYRGGVKAGADHCPGQLRTAYVRLTVGAVVNHGWVQKAGKPSWAPVGVLCDACRAFWPAPVAQEGTKS